MPVANFIRRVKLVIFPQEVVAALGVPEGAQLVIESDGSNSTLGMSFVCSAMMFGYPSKATIRIHNLSPDRRGALVKARAKVSLRVALGDSEEWEVFNGGVVSCITRREGADYVTTLTCMKAIAQYAATPTSATYSGGAELKSVLISEAGKMEGVVVDPVKIKIPTSIRVTPGGVSFGGSVADSVTRLARNYGFSWFLDTGNTFHAFMDGQAMYQTVKTVSYRNKNLIHAFPMLTGWMQHQVGVEIRALLSPGFFVGDKVDLKARANEYLDGTYVVHAIDWRGSTVTDEWTMDLKCMVYQEGYFYKPQGQL